MVTKLYRKKYIIGIYRKSDDYAIAILDNEYQFAEFFDISIENARMKLSYFFNKKVQYLKYKGQICEVYFILDL